MNHARVIEAEPLARSEVRAVAERPLRSGPSCDILCVEDDESWRCLSSDVLGKAGYRVDVAEDGEAGWEALRLGSYDLLITDNDMPRLTGMELVRRLRAEGHTLPVVMASGSFNLGEAQRDQTLRVAMTLRKPFTSKQLLETVEEVLRAASGVRKRADLFLPMLTEPRARIHQVRGWGINE